MPLVGRTEVVPRVQATSHPSRAVVWGRHQFPGLQVWSQAMGCPRGLAHVCLGLPVSWVGASPQAPPS